MDTRDSLLQKWESIEVPATYISGPDLEADEGLKQRDTDFFDAVRVAIGLGERAVRAGIVTVEYRNLLSTKDHVTDDKVQLWSLNGVQPLAMLLKTRNDPNFIVAQFSKYSLTDHAVDRILRFQERADELDKEAENK